MRSSLLVEGMSVDGLRSSGIDVVVLGNAKNLELSMMSDQEVIACCCD